MSERVRMEEVEEGRQMTGEGQSGHVRLTQIGGQVPDVYQEIKKKKKKHVTLKYTTFLYKLPLDPPPPPQETDHGEATCTFVILYTLCDYVSVHLCV